MWLAIGALPILCGSALAQHDPDGSGAGGRSLRSQWEQRVLQTAYRPSPAAAGLTDYRLAPRPLPRSAAAGDLASAGHGQPTVAAQGDAVMLGGPEVVPLGQILPAQPAQSGPTASEDGDPPGGYGMDAPGCAPPGTFGGPGACGNCGAWAPDYGRCGYPGWPGGGILDCFWWQDLSLFAGVQGFKGPPDQGLNGNFGFHEGVNFGAPLGAFDIGYQLGFAAAQSNFSGDLTLTAFSPAQTLTDRHGDRHQYFFTGGLFHRALCGGAQWGVVFDWMREMYYDEADLKQIRSETSLVFPGGWDEIGYFGAYNVGSDRLRLQDRLRNEILLAPTDMFVGFYRRHFETGGEGRLWAGVSGRGNALLGADLRVPLGGSWALENSINFLVPNHGRGADGLREEAWGLNIRLVWYPGRRAACVQNSGFRPLLSVADNSTFLVHASATQATAQ